MLRLSEGWGPRRWEQTASAGLDCCGLVQVFISAGWVVMMVGFRTLIRPGLPLVHRSIRGALWTLCMALEIGGGGGILVVVDVPG